MLSEYVERAVMLEDLDGVVSWDATTRSVAIVSEVAALLRGGQWRRPRDGVAIHETAVVSPTATVELANPTGSIDSFGRLGIDGLDSIAWFEPNRIRRSQKDCRICRRHRIHLPCDRQKTLFEVGPGDLVMVQPPALNLCASFLVRHDDQIVRRMKWK